MVILEEVLLKNAIEHLGQGFVGFKQRAIGYVLVEPFTSFLVESGWAANRSVDCEAQNAIPKSKHTSFVQDQNQRHHHHFDGEVVMHASLGFVWEILVAMVVPMVVQWQWERAKQKGRGLFERLGEGFKLNSRRCKACQSYYYKRPNNVSFILKKMMLTTHSTTSIFKNRCWHCTSNISFLKIGVQSLFVTLIF